MTQQETLDKIKLRLGMLYTDPLKDEELTDRITAAMEDIKGAGVSITAIETQLGLDTIERYLRGGQNDNLYIANIIKLRLVGETN